MPVKTIKSHFGRRRTGRDLKRILERVHLSEAGTPVVGDRTYGKRSPDPEVAAAAERLGRQALHAAVLRFRHPVTGTTIDLLSPMPQDMQDLVAALRRHGGTS